MQQNKWDDAISVLVFIVATVADPGAGRPPGPPKKKTTTNHQTPSYTDAGWNFF
jgi:hypothetical protein